MTLTLTRRHQLLKSVNQYSVGLVIFNTSLLQYYNTTVTVAELLSQCQQFKFQCD